MNPKVIDRYAKGVTKLLSKAVARWPATKRHVQTVAGDRKHGN